MVRSGTLAALVVAACCSVVLATKCSLGSKCPKDSPCCSQYGECGVGAYCLGGCDPRMSFSLNSCVPAPECKSTRTTFKTLDSVVDISKYLGDASKADWMAQGEPALHNGNVLLTMPKKSVGTVLASTSYMWYGNVKARFKTSRGRGVVTAFILLSDVKDEIDFEFVGADLSTAQTNYYFQGVPDYHNSGNISLPNGNSFDSFHDYEIRWTPDKIEWLVDNRVGRTKLRKDTWNATTQQWDYPQTPARVQLSLWPGGLASNAKGTINWAGGEIDWDADDIKQIGYYYATLAEVSIECYKTNSAPGTNKGTSYTYSDAKGTNDTVVDGDKKTVLGSLEASGLDMDKGKKEASSSSAASTDGADKPKETQKTIPGGSNGSQGQDHSGQDSSGDKGSGSSGGGGGGGGDSSGSSNPAGGSSGCDSKTFSQNCGSPSPDKPKGGGTKTRASALAMAIAGMALYWL